MADFKNARIIHTCLYSSKAKEVMDSVFGQLADGWGENNPRNDMWWKFGKVDEAPDGEVLIVVSGMSGEVDYRHKWVTNGFYGMDGQAVKTWMARMIKKTITMELKDSVCTGGWKRNNESFKTMYLGNGRDTSVADVYCIYEMLLGRDVGIVKYEARVINSVVGVKRTPDMVEIEPCKRQRMNELREANDALIASLNKEEKSKVDELNAQINFIKSEYIKKRQAAIAELQQKAEAEGLVSKL